uniref:Uncharacterized protein n=1 Tax=Anguilla anguilla TaxID=7936 RepID=A0A0E9S2U1_ANGAN
MCPYLSQQQIPGCAVWEITQERTVIRL